MISESLGIPIKALLQQRFHCMVNGTDLIYNLFSKGIIFNYDNARSSLTEPD